MKYNRLMIVFLFVILVTESFGAALTTATNGYTIKDLGIIPGFANTSVNVHMISNNGLIAGYAYNKLFLDGVAFVWKKGHFTVLPNLRGAAFSSAFGVNDRGQAVGISGSGSPAFPDFHAVLWENGMAMALPEATGDNVSQAFAINQRGDIIGASGFVDTNGTITYAHAIVWHDGIMTVLPEIYDGASSNALGINEKGQIVGHSGGANAPIALDSRTEPVLWDNGTIMDLSVPLDQMPPAQAFAINEQGQIVGATGNDNVPIRAVLWDHGTITNLGAPGGVRSFAHDINNKGQIVGGVVTSSNNTVPILWENGMATDLTTQIPVDSGWTELRAGGINDRGQIAGGGFHNGKLRSFLMTPKKKK